MNQPLVKSWLGAFLVSHEAMHPAARWPAVGSEPARRLWSKWLQAFIEAKVTQEEARQASVGLDDSGWCEDHPSLVVDAVVAFRRQEAEARAAQPVRPAEETDAERMDTAMALLDEFYGAGWELRWIEEEGRFRAYSTREGTTPPADTFRRMKKYQYEIYSIMGHPYPDVAMFRDASGGFDWRAMVKALADGGASGVVRARGGRVGE